MEGSRGEHRVGPDRSELGCSKTVVVPCSERVKLDHDGGNRRAGKRLKNQVE